MINQYKYNYIKDTCVIYSYKYMCLQYTNLYFFSPIYDDNPGNKNKEKGNSAGLT